MSTNKLACPTKDLAVMYIVKRMCCKPSGPGFAGTGGILAEELLLHKKHLPSLKELLNYPSRSIS